MGIRLAMARVSLLLFGFLFIRAAFGQTELLQNPDFEDLFDESNWRCTNCNLGRSTDSYTGQYSALVTERGANWASVTQDVTLEGGKTYYFRAMFKIRNRLNDHQFHDVTCMLQIDFTDGERQYVTFAKNPHVTQDYGWLLHGGDVTIKNKAVSTARVYFQIPQIGVNYVVDTASLTEIIPNPNWLEEANARIEQLRKADITFAVNISGAYNPADIELSVNLNRHAIPFGSAISARHIVATDATGQKYQDFFFNNFEYSVIENALKWQSMEPVEGVIDYDTSGNAITALENRGVPVRGHCVFWEVEKWVPEWLKSMTGEQVRAQISRRAQGVVGRFKGRLVHWDVNNEDLHGEFYKVKTGDNTIIHTMFSEVHQHDTDAKLFLNEYGVVNSNKENHAYLNQAIRLKNTGVAIYGVGVQSHISGYLRPEVLKHRIDILAEAGLPIWITELDYENTDRNARADGYALALRLYYSHPNIEGIMLWGFWDGRHWKPNAALVEGDDFTINAAGLRYQQLVKNEWHTSATLRPTSSSQQLSLRGFQGSYTVDVKNKGNTIKTLTFAVPNKVTSYQVTVDV